MATANFQLPCLTDQSPAAVALLMQTLARDIDAALTAQLASFNSFLNAPTAIAISTAPTTVGVLSTRTIIGSLTTQFTNYAIPTNPFGLTLAGGSLGFPNTATPTWYHVGGYARLQPTGAVTNNTLRQLVVTVSSLIIDPSGTTQLEQWEDQSYETNTAGEFLTVDGTVKIPANSYATADLSFVHTNAGSSVQATTGALLWLTRLGDDNPIGAA